MSARICPVCGKSLGTAADFGAMLFLVFGFPAWLAMLWHGLRQYQGGNRPLGVVLVGAGLAVVAALASWILRRSRKK